jgi:5-methylcytosine-specific restriction protein B
VARHLGRWLVGLAEPPPERLTVIQFHPAYSYEEFIEGIRPESREQGGRSHVHYPTRPGVFVRFCRRAEQVDGPCVFVIDEINRGHVARIFGELMLLLEYRDQAIPLPYSGEMFRIPPNVHLIATMNTADRSIALVDFALRRRFHFFRFAADPDLFDHWLAEHPPAVPYLSALYRRLAAEAIDDPDFAIGPSHFMRPLDEAGLARVWRRSIMPYLEEYYVDQPARAGQWAWEGELVRSLREL